MFFWSVNKVYPQIEHHNVFLSGECRASFDPIFERHALPDVPSFYVHARARTDSAAAPEGQDTLVVLVPVGLLREGDGQAWEEMTARARTQAPDCRWCCRPDPPFPR